MPDALVFSSPWTLGLRPQPPCPAPGPAEVTVRVCATGICGTDIGIVSGGYAARPGVVLGHESAGVVVAVGESVTAVAIGDRVAIDPTYFCGECRMCRTERPNHCEQKAFREAGVSQDGTFAPLFQTDARFVYPIADHVSFEAASLAEPLSCALTGLNQIRVRPDADCVILGGGPMGMLYAHALSARGATGAIVEASAGRRAFCRAAAPAGWQVRAPCPAAADTLDIVVDCSGQGLEWALAALRRGGQLLVVGLSAGSASLSPASLADRSLSVVGSIDSIGTFGAAVRMIESGRLPADRLISHRLPLAEFAKGFALLGLDLEARRRTLAEIRALKVVLTV